LSNAFTREPALNLTNSTGNRRHGSEQDADAQADVEELGRFQRQVRADQQALERAEVLHILERALGRGEDRPQHRPGGVPLALAGAALGGTEVRLEPRPEPEPGTRREPEAACEQDEPADDQRQQERRRRRAPG
jgi:ClpP class serine protease